MTQLDDDDDEVIVKEVLRWWMMQKVLRFNNSRMTGMDHSGHIVISAALAQDWDRRWLWLRHDWPWTWKSRARTEGSSMGSAT